MKIINGTNAGFFANVCDVLRHIYLAEQQDVDCFIQWGKEMHYYDGLYGSNVWEYYFTQLNEYDDLMALEPVSGYVPIPLQGAEFRKEFNRLIDEHIHVNPIVGNVIQNTLTQLPKDYIGVHIRYTDKNRYTQFGEPSSAAPLPLSVYQKYIDRARTKFGVDSIFLATDDEDVVVNFRKQYGDDLHVLQAPRSTGTLSVHADKKDVSGYIKGLSVLCDVMVLANSKFLIRSTSNVGSFAQFLNLNLEHVNVNEVECGDTREAEFGLVSTNI